MPVFEIPLGEWLPDQPDYKNPGAVVADNCYPVAQGFGPFESALPSAATTTEQVSGAAMFFDNSGNAMVASGSSTKLATKRFATIVETSGYSPVSSGWRFERFSDLIVATSIENDPQYLTDIDTDDVWSPLPGTPPRAAQVGRVGDFLVFGDLVDIASLGNPIAPNRVRWGAFNNPTANWVTDRGELSDYRDLDPRYGRVTAIVGGRFGLIFQERAIWRMTFVGAPKVFDFVEVSVDRGCIASGTAVTIAAETFFLSQDGFWKTNGSEVEPIGAEKVNNWFGQQASDADLTRTHGAVNWPKRSIVWTFYPNGAMSFSRQIIFNFVLRKWSSAQQTVDYLVRSQVDALSIGDLGALFASIGDMTAYTLGSSEWKARSLSFAAYVPGGSGSVFAEFSGAAANASFVTADAQIEAGYRSRLTGAWPVVETQTAAITTRVRTKDTQGGSIASTADKLRAADGFCPHNVDGWLHSVRIDIPAGEVWDNASGLQVRAVRTGRR